MLISQRFLDSRTVSEIFEVAVKSAGGVGGLAGRRRRRWDGMSARGVSGHVSVRLAAGERLFGPVSPSAGVVGRNPVAAERSAGGQPAPTPAAVQHPHYRPSPPLPGCLLPFGHTLLSASSGRHSTRTGRSSRRRQHHRRLAARQTRSDIS